MEDDRKKDEERMLIPAHGTGQTHRHVSLDVVKSAFIAEGLSIQEVADRYYLSIPVVEKLVEEHNLVELRKTHIREGLAKIQSVQLSQAEKLMNIELDFKKLRLIQLEQKLHEYAAYYARHNDFYKRHPVTGDILRDTDGIAMQLSVPNVTREISQLKESLTLSEGLKKLLNHIDDIINAKPKRETITDGDGDNVIDVNVDSFFTKK